MEKPIENNYPYVHSGFTWFGQVWENDGLWRQPLRDAGIEFLCDPGSNISDVYFKKHEFEKAGTILKANGYLEEGGK